MKNIYYLTPSSFCFGVSKAVEQLRNICNKHQNEQIFCIHELVHNPNTNQEFKDRGVIFIDDMKDIPTTKAVVIFSAHGINRKIFLEAQKQFQTVYNLECPLVTKIYIEINLYIEKWINNFVYIGKQWHQEAENVKNYIKYLWAKCISFSAKKEIPILPKEDFAVISQTTLNFNHISKILEKIQKKYPQAQIPKSSDICKATADRQSIITQNLNKFDTLIVIWGKNSSNTKELVKIWKTNHKKTYFAQSLEELLNTEKEEDLLQSKNIAITGWASTPTNDIKKIFQHFQKKWFKWKILSLYSTTKGIWA